MQVGVEVWNFPAEVGGLNVKGLWNASGCREVFQSLFSDALQLVRVGKMLSSCEEILSEFFLYAFHAVPYRLPGEFLQTHDFRIVQSYFHQIAGSDI